MVHFDTHAKQSREIVHFTYNVPRISPLKPSGNCMYHTLYKSVTLQFSHTVHLWVLYDSESK